MNNPYKVLEISENATQEEIRAAYLRLVKQYHPDKYRDNPLKELATEKLKEINEAYETLTKKGGASTYDRDPYRSGFNDSYNAYQGPNAAEFARARMFVNQNNLNAAKQILDSIPTRNGEWYYLYGIIHLRQGWYDKAREYLVRAYEMDPDNSEYRNAYQAFMRSGSPYQSSRRPMDNTDGSCSGCDVCTTLLCADCCCECMGGDLIRCC